MATSDVKIVNLALRQLRASPIAALSDAAAEAQLANEIYADARDYILAAHPWNFAMSRQTLSRDATGPAFGFTYSFSLPTLPHCLRAWKLNGSTDLFQADGDRFKIEGRKLVSDVAEANLLYVARIEDVTTYSPGFVQALAAYLAWQMAYALTANVTERDKSAQAFDMIFRKARALDGAEDFADDAPTSPFVTGRY